MRRVYHAGIPVLRRREDMRAEMETLVGDIKQSVELLRRRL